MPSDATRAPAGALDPAQTATVAAVLDRLRDLPGALLPILHAIQEELGFVPPAALGDIAAALNLSVADVHGVVTFYHDFRSAPPGAHVLKVCRAEACQAMGNAGLERHVAQRTGVQDLHGTTADGQLTVEPVYCLGNCALSPAVQLDGRVHGKVTPARLDALLAKAGVGAGGRS